MLYYIASCYIMLYYSILSGLAAPPPARSRVQPLSFPEVPDSHLPASVKIVTFRQATVGHATGRSAPGQHVCP